MKMPDQGRDRGRETNTFKSLLPDRLRRSAHPKGRRHYAHVRSARTPSELFLFLAFRLSERNPSAGTPHTPTAARNNLREASVISSASHPRLSHQDAPGGVCSLLAGAVCGVPALGFRHFVPKGKRN